MLHTRATAAAAAGAAAVSRGGPFSTVSPATPPAGGVPAHFEPLPPPRVKVVAMARRPLGPDGKLVSGDGDGTPASCTCCCCCCRRDAPYTFIVYQTPIPLPHTCAAPFARSQRSLSSHSRSSSASGAKRKFSGISDGEDGGEVRVASRRGGGGGSGVGASGGAGGGGVGGSGPVDASFVDGGAGGGGSGGGGGADGGGNAGGSGSAGSVHSARSLRRRVGSGDGAALTAAAAVAPTTEVDMTADLPHTSRSAEEANVLGAGGSPGLHALAAPVAAAAGALMVAAAAPGVAHRPPPMARVLGGGGGVDDDDMGVEVPGGGHDGSGSTGGGGGGGGGMDGWAVSATTGARVASPLRASLAAHMQTSLHIGGGMVVEGGAGVGAWEVVEHPLSTLPKRAALCVLAYLDATDLTRLYCTAHGRGATMVVPLTTPPPHALARVVAVSGDTASPLQGPPRLMHFDVQGAGDRLSSHAPRGAVTRADGGVGAAAGGSGSGGGSGSSSITAGSGGGGLSGRGLMAPPPPQLPPGRTLPSLQTREPPAAAAAAATLAASAAAAAAIESIRGRSAAAPESPAGPEGGSHGGVATRSLSNKRRGSCSGRSGGSGGSGGSGVSGGTGMSGAVGGLRLSAAPAMPPRAALMYALAMEEAKHRVVRVLRLEERAATPTASTALYGAAAVAAAAAAGAGAGAGGGAPLSTLHPDLTAHDRHPTLHLEVLAHRAQEAANWLEVAVEVGEWGRMRAEATALHAAGAAAAAAAISAAAAAAAAVGQLPGSSGARTLLPAALPSPDYWRMPDAGLEGEATLYDNMVRLRDKEDILARTFPHWSLYHRFIACDDDWELRMNWRQRLVDWLGSLMTHFGLLHPVLADAVALADRYIVEVGARVGRTTMQLLFLTAVVIAARVHRVPASVINELRTLAPEYGPSDYTSMESRMVAAMGTTSDRRASSSPAPAAGSGAAAASGTGAGTSTTAASNTAVTVATSASAGASVASLPAHRPVPAAPQGILARFSPDAVEPTMPTVQMVVITTPFAVAGHIICFMSRSWGEAIAPIVREALFLAMKYFDAQRFSPITIAVACVYLGLRARGLWGTPTATAWLRLTNATLQVDMFSVREAALLLAERAEAGSVLAVDSTARRELRAVFDRVNDPAVTAAATPAAVRAHVDALANCAAAAAVLGTPAGTPLPDWPVLLAADAGDAEAAYYEPWMGKPVASGEVNLSSVIDALVDSASAMQARQQNYERERERVRRRRARVAAASAAVAAAAAAGTFSGTPATAAKSSNAGGQAARSTGTTPAAAAGVGALNSSPPGAGTAPLPDLHPGMAVMMAMEGPPPHLTSALALPAIAAQPGMPLPPAGVFMHSALMAGAPAQWVPPRDMRLPAVAPAHAYGLAAGAGGARGIAMPAPVPVPPGAAAGGAAPILLATGVGGVPLPGVRAPGGGTPAMAAPAVDHAGVGGGGGAGGAGPGPGPSGVETGGGGRGGGPPRRHPAHRRE